jgi:hypothetical protein
MADRTHKKAVDLKGLSQQKKSYKQRLSNSTKARALGVAGDKIVEPIPEYLSTPSEKLITGFNNTILVMGRDRTGNVLTGYGGRGDTQCGSIDIIAGRMGYLSREVNKKNKKLWADPNFKLDAARIYISQKTDVDEAFGLADGIVGHHKTKSAIAVKADHLRFIAREGIKLITGTDTRNSQGSKVDSVNGIDLIAGNDDSDMQALVKGKNLVEAFKALVKHIQKLTSTVDTLLTWQMKYNASLISHTHISPFYGLATSPSLQLLQEGPNVMMNHLQGTKMGIMSMKTNLVGFKHNYLSPSGKKYINSRYNHTN